jgi:hypothetical protein
MNRLIISSLEFIKIGLANISLIGVGFGLVQKLGLRANHTLQLFLLEVMTIMMGEISICQRRVGIPEMVIMFAASAFNYLISERGMMLSL